MTSGGETRRLGTGETGQALAEEGEGDQVNKSTSDFTLDDISITMASQK